MTNQFEMGKKAIAEEGKRIQIINNFKFGHQNKLISHKERWNHTAKICKYYLQVDENDKIVFNESKLLDNNHEPLTEPVLKRQKISNSLRRKAVANIMQNTYKGITYIIEGT